MLSSVCSADEVEPLVERDLACAGDTLRLQGLRFRGLPWGSPWLCCSLHSSACCLKIIDAFRHALDPDLVFGHGIG